MYVNYVYSNLHISQEKLKTVMVPPAHMVLVNSVL